MLKFWVAWYTTCYNIRLVGLKKTIFSLVTWSNDTVEGTYAFALDWRIVMAVSANEASTAKGLYTSNLFEKSNNAFGMRCSKQRKKYWSYETDSNFAGYSSVRNSVRDFFDRIKNFKLRSNTGTFDCYYVGTGLISNGYCDTCTSDGYVAAIEAYYEKTKKFFNPLWLLIATIGVSATAAIIYLTTRKNAR